MNSLWTPTRINAIWIGALSATFLAAFFGILYGAWAIFQPFPQLSIGPVSVYLIAAVILCLIAAWEIGKRALMIEKGYGNPAWTTPVALVALAAGCVGIWAASIVATVHTPDASAKNQVHVPVQAQARAPAPLTPDQSDTISKKYCAGGDTAACISTALLVANETVGLYQDHKRTCNALSGATDQVSIGVYRDCRARLWDQMGDKYRTQQAISTACDQADALRIQLPADQQNSPELQCADVYHVFIASDPTDPSTDPPGV